jgi:hypothetical protein
MMSGRCGSLAPRILITFWEMTMSKSAGTDVNKTHGNQKARIKHALNLLNITRIRSLYRLFHPNEKPNWGREEMIAIVLRILCFETQEKFNEWFGSLRQGEQTIIRKLTFYKALPVRVLEVETGMNIISERIEQYRTTATVNADFRLHSLEFVITHDVAVVVMPEVLQIALRPFLEPPVYYGMNGAISGETTIFNNEQNFSAVFDLFYERFLSHDSTVRTATRQDAMKFAKKEIESLYRESGFPRFPVCNFPVPDSLRLALSFVISQYDSALPKTGGDALREMVHRFFFFDPANSTDYFCFSGSYFEGVLASTYMKKRGPIGFETVRELPEFRQTFYDFLKSIEDRDAPVAMDEAFSRILAKGIFRFSSIDVSHYFRFRASSLMVDYNHYRAFGDELTPEHTLFFELITKPLFQAYCFVFCAIGCLELAVARPPYNASDRGQEFPISPYTGVYAVRLTAFGKWCLGFTEEKPPEVSPHYEITAHPTMFYVTLRGESFPRQVFLDKVGIKMGEERWAINAASFLSGCTEKSNVIERINKFHNIIDEHPAEHWETCLAQIEKNVKAMEEVTGNFLVYRIDIDRETRAALLRDTAFRKIAQLAEDNLVLVPKKNRQKFLSTLTEHGIAAFTVPRPSSFPHQFD